MEIGMINIENRFAEANQSLFTIRDFLRFAVSIFTENELSYGHGTTNAYDEAVYLILHTLNLPLDQLEPYLDARLLNDEKKHILDVLLLRVADKLPAPYITNEANFHGYSFYVDQRTIIPRSFIAEIILQDGLDDFIEHPELIHNVLDLCTGNGSLAIIASDYFYDSETIAVDIDSSALEVAQININNYGLDEKITTIQSDLFSELGDSIKFDIILSNPPYVDSSRMDELPPEYTHEPQIALFGGENGLFLVSKIINNAKDYLTEYGILVVEMGDNRMELEEMYPDLPFIWLSTKSGEGFVFVLSKADLEEYFD